MSVIVALIVDVRVDPPELVERTRRNVLGLGPQFILLTGRGLTQAAAFNDLIPLIAREEDANWVQFAFPGTEFSQSYFNQMAMAAAQVPTNIGLMWAPWYFGNQSDDLAELHQQGGGKPGIKPGITPPGPYAFLHSRLTYFDPPLPFIRRDAIIEAGPMGWDWYDPTGDDPLKCWGAVPAYCHRILEHWWAHMVPMDPADSYTFTVPRGTRFRDPRGIELCRSRLIMELMDGKPTRVDLPENVPFVHITIPSYNHPDFITQAIDSVMGQDYPPNQVAVTIVDDASTDDTASIVAEHIKQYEGQDIVQIVREENGGMREALKVGYEHAKDDGANLWMMVSSDDFLVSPDLISKSVETLIGRPDAVATTPAIAHTDADGEWDDVPFHTKGNQRIGVFRPIDIDPRVYVAHNYSGLGGSLFRMEAISKAGGLYVDEIHNNLTDYSLFMRVAQVGRVVAVRDALFGYRAHEQANRFQRDEGDHEEALRSFRIGWMQELGYMKKEQEQEQEVEE